MPRARKSSEDVFSNEVEALLKRLTTRKKPWTLRRARRAFERAYADYMMRRFEGDRKQVAAKLDISISSLKEKIKQPKV